MPKKTNRSVVGQSARSSGYQLHPLASPPQSQANGTRTLNIVRFSGESFSVRIEKSLRIEALKERIKSLENLGATSDVNLTCGCENLDDALLISDLPLDTLNLCISPAPLLMSGSADGTIRISRSSTGQRVKILQCNGIHVGASLRIAPLVHVNALLRLDMDTLASGSSDGVVRIWKLRTGKCTKVLGLSRTGDEKSVAPDAVQTLSKLAVNDCIASGSAYGIVRIWSLCSGECLTSMNVWSEGIRSCGYFEAIVLRGLCCVEGKLACALIDGTIQICRCDDCTTFATLKGHKSAVNAVVCLPGDQLASGSDDAALRIWNLADCSCCHALEGHEQPINTLAYLEIAKWLASGSQDQSVRIWSMHTGECVSILRGFTSSVWSIIFTDEGLLASGSGDKLVRIWNCETGECTLCFAGHVAPVTCLA